MVIDASQITEGQLEKENARYYMLRSLVCYWAVREIGMNATSVGKLLGIDQPAVSRAVVRGEKLIRDMNLSLF